MVEGWGPASVVHCVPWDAAIGGRAAVSIQHCRLAVPPSPRAQGISGCGTHSELVVGLSIQDLAVRALDHLGFVGDGWARNRARRS